MAQEEAKDAKRAAIYSLLRGYWQLAEKLDRSLLNTYSSAVDECSIEAVKLVCQRIASGQAGLNSSFPPTPADIAERAILLDAGGKPAPRLYNGLIEMDWGHGRVDLRGLKQEEQDKLIELKGMMPDGRNAALLTLDQKRDGLKTERIAGPRRAAIPKMKDMR